MYMKTYQHEKEGLWYVDVNDTSQSLLLFFQFPESFCVVELIEQIQTFFNQYDLKIVVV